MDRRTFLKSITAISALGFVEKASAFSLKKEVSLDKLKELSIGQELVVAYNNGNVMTYKGNGIKPVFDHLEHKR